MNHKNIKNNKRELSSFREYLHKHPEASLNEFQTTQFIREALQELLDLLTHEKKKEFSIHTPLKTGLILEWKHSVKAPFLVFRADIDALPAPEGKGYRGYMHACGHDVHTSILFGFIQKLLLKSDESQDASSHFPYNFLFVFQPAEEEGGGALSLIQQGFFKNYSIEAAYALHVSDEYKIGEFASNSQTLFASALAFDLTFLGKASHLAFPDRGHNAFSALYHFISLVGLPQEKEGLLWGFGRVEAGHVRNILPDKALIQGSIRAKNSAEAIAFFHYLKDKAQEAASFTQTKALLSEVSFYPAVQNNAKLFSLLKNGLPELIECPMKYTGEDFGCFSEVFPSLMIWLGTRKEGENIVGLHHEDFCPSDDVIPKGIDLFMKILEGHEQRDE